MHVILARVRVDLELIALQAARILKLLLQGVLENFYKFKKLIVDYKYTQNFFYLRDRLLGLDLSFDLLRFLFLTLINPVLFSIKFYFDKILGLSFSKGLGEGLSVRFSF